MSAVEAWRPWFLMLLFLAGGSAAASPPSAKTTPARASHETAPRDSCGWIRSCIARPEDAHRFGLKPLGGPPTPSASGPRVVLLHGFNSHPDRCGGLVAEARALGLECLGFAYPNDQGLEASARLLSAALKELGPEPNRRPVKLVAHSMGGLIARECIENPSLNPGCVDELIMVAPPTRGSRLAKLAVATDVWEHWIARADGGPWRRTRDSILDGLGEAATDMAPGSPFLTRLNARPLAPGVQYSILLGDRAAVTDDQLTWLVDCLASTEGAVCGGRAWADSLADWDEVVLGRGDGAVALCRGRHPLVSDTLVLPFGHLSVACGDSTDEGAVRARREVLARLTD